MRADVSSCPCPIPGSSIDGAVMERVLITGATGFIGAHLVRDGVARGDRVTVVARPGSDPWRLADLAGRIEVAHLDPGDAPGLAALLRRTRPGRVFHLAAATRLGGAGPAHALACNVAPLQTLLTALHEAGHRPDSLVRTGSLAELGEAPHTLTDDARERPGTAYGLSALMGTHLLRLARPGLGFPAVTARLALTYGGGQSGDFLIADGIRKGLDGVPLSPTRPHAERDLLHVGDVVAALRLIADRAQDLPDTVVVSTGQPVRMSALCRMIQSLTAGQPAPIAAADPATPPDGRLSCHPSAALLALGWAPGIALPCGLQQVIAWERAARHHPPKERCA